MSRHKKAHRAPAATPTPVQGRNRLERSRSENRRLHLVTALLLTAEEFPGELGESFGAACAAVGVEPATSGYGLVLAQDQPGGRRAPIPPSPPRAPPPPSPPSIRPPSTPPPPPHTTAPAPP